jgi:hypothetical protein
MTGTEGPMTIPLRSPLALLLRERHPDTRFIEDTPVLRAVIAVDGHWHTIRVRTHPLAEIYVGLPALDGFDLVVADALSGWPWRKGDVPFDGRYRVTTNDPVLAALWLDPPSARAIAGLRFDDSQVWQQPPPAPAAPPAERGWRFEVAGAELAVLKGGLEPDLERLHDALIAGATVAAAAHRCADAWRDLAMRVGGAATSDRWDLGGDFAILCDRQGTAVRVDHLRVRPDEPPDEHRLRTRIRAARVTTRDDALVAWRRGALGQPMRPARKLPPVAAEALGIYQARATTSELGRARLDAYTRGLLQLSGVDALELDAAEVVAWYDGACDDPARLDAAIELCARLAVDDAAHAGPYR